MLDLAAVESNGLAGAFAKYVGIDRFWRVAICDPTDGLSGDATVYHLVCGGHCECDDPIDGGDCQPLLAGG